LLTFTLLNMIPVIFYLFIDNNYFALEDFFNSLPNSLQQEINCYKLEEERLLRIASKLLLQRGLQQYFPGNAPALSELKKDIYNKPFFKDVHLAFNTAHSKHLCVAAFSPKGKIGIDTEYRKEIDISIYNDFLHPAEKILLEKSAEKNIAFYNAWTKKEAVLKASGKPIQQELNTIDTGSEPIIIKAEKYFTHPISLFEDYTTCVAANFEINEITITEIIP
jgi:4'-phosphopantetheinyl transferase